MAILARLLNKTIYIKRIVENVTLSGDDETDIQLIGTASARIARNKQEGESVGSAGIVVSSTHKMFTNIGINIVEGDYVVDGTDYYIVSYVDKIPAGKTDSHCEIYMNKTDKEVDGIYQMSEVS